MVCEAGVDKIIFGMTVPGDSVIHDIHADMSIHVDTDQNFATGTFYGLEGYILPLMDPDAAISFQTLWDNLVPKDTDTQVIDLDTAAADATPFFEPGEADWAQVLDIGMRPEKIYGRYKMLTCVGQSLVTSTKDTESPFGLEGRYGDRFDLRVRKNYRVRQPSAVLFAIASPAMDDTTSTVEAALEEDELPRIKYARQMLEMALMDLIGLTEAGAEVPWEDATDLLQKHLEPDVFEETAAAWFSPQLSVFCDAKLRHSVVGSLSVKTLSTGR